MSNNPAGYIAIDQSGQPVADSYGAVMLFKSVEDARSVGLSDPLYRVKRLIRAKVKRKKAEKK